MNALTNAEGPDFRIDAATGRLTDEEGDKLPTRIFDLYFSTVGEF